MGLLAAYSVVRGLMGAAARPLWFDELLTLTIASQPNLHDMWSAIMRGFDTQPPAFYLLERACLALPIAKQIALRLPSIFAFPLVLVCVFTYVKKRNGEMVACLCAVLFFSTSLFRTYLTEARGYSLMFACIALALVCYQRFSSIRWVVLLGLSLILAESFHYYAVFAMIPFGLAEIVLSLSTRRARWPIWAALACGTLPLMISWPILRAIKILYGSQVFSRAVFSQVPGYYGSYFLTSHAFGLELAAVSIAAIVWSYLWPKQALLQPAGHQANDVSEAALLLGLNVLPLIVFVLVSLTHGVLLDRYALATTIGVAFGIASALYTVRPEAIVLFAILLFPTVGRQEGSFWRHKGVQTLRPYSIQSPTEFGQIQEFVQSGGHPNLPVVITQGMVYFQMVYYSPPEWTKRLVYLTDSDKELAFEGTDTIVKAMVGLRDYSPVRVVNYGQFTTTQREFLVYSDGAGWILENLSREAASVRLLKLDKGRCLYLMQMRASPE